MMVVIRSLSLSTYSLAMLVVQSPFLIVFLRNIHVNEFASNDEGRFIRNGFQIDDLIWPHLVLSDQVVPLIVDFQFDGLFDFIAH
jgi:hypothetical protein